jgi:hypothetical protein
MDTAISDWAGFFGAQVGASAALVGLVVVAISINLTRILANPHLPGRAAEGLIILVGALLTNSLALIPARGYAPLGAEALIVGLATFLIVLTIQLRSLELVAHIPPVAKYVRFVVTSVASLPIAVGGLLLAFGLGAGLHWIAAGVLLSLIAGVYNTWVLLIEILR